MSGEAVLVTGGAGYVGSHACKALAEAGWLPVVYDNFSRGHEWAVRWGPVESGDVLDRARLDAIMRAYRPAAVMHFAALAEVGESVQDPALYYRNNVAGTISLVESMREAGIDRLVFSSTCAVYGMPDVVPISEDSPVRPISPYGASKAMAERVIADSAAAYDLKAVSLRYFNAAGADPEGEIGESHEPESHLIPIVLEAALRRRRHVTIFGDEHDTPDGTCIRDYVHVTDLADAHIRALERLDTGALRAAYNLGSGCGASVAEVLAAARAVTGIEIPAERGPKRAGDPARLVAGAAAAHDDLDWRPQHSTLDAIIGTAWAWACRDEAVPQKRTAVL